MTTTLTGRTARSIPPTRSHLAGTTLTRRQILTAGAGLGALFSLPASLGRTSAQTGPSATIPSARAGLKSLGLPEIAVSIGEFSVTAPSEVEAGWMTRQPWHGPWMPAATISPSQTGSTPAGRTASRPANRPCSPPGWRPGTTTWPSRTICQRRVRGDHDARAADGDAG